MTFRDDDNLNRPRPLVGRDEGYGWGIPLAVIAAILILGGIFFMGSGDRTQTASNTDRPAVTTPSPAPAKTPTTTPAPAPAPKQ